MTQGSCLCGAVRFEFDGPYSWFLHCHCSMCRKHHGTFHGSAVGVQTSKFRFVGGADAIVHFRSSPAFERPFCKYCGSKVPAITGEYAAIPAGTINEELSGPAPLRIFVAHKSPMEVITDDARQFDSYPPGYGIEVSPPSAETTEPGISGSCLCGAVAFEIDGTPEKIVQCHCSRCRRSRGTAHAVNTFVPEERVRIVRGAEKIKSFRPPDASRFETTFCERCGSPVPGKLALYKVYLIPVGFLDAPFKLHATTNIYVASKAKWFTLTNRSPQFDELPPRERIPELLLG
jgi:hypothetical protein